MLDMLTALVKYLADFCVCAHFAGMESFVDFFRAILTVLFVSLSQPSLCKERSVFLFVSFVKRPPNLFFLRCHSRMLTFALIGYELNYLMTTSMVLFLMFVVEHA